MQNDKSSQSSHSTTPLYTTPDNHPFFYPTRQKISIVAVNPNRLALNANSEDSVPDNSLCEQVASCGFNAIAFRFNILSSTLVSKARTVVLNCLKNNLTPFIGNSKSEDRLTLAKYFAQNSMPVHLWLDTPEFTGADYDKQTAFNKGLVNSYQEILKTFQDNKPTSSTCHYLILMNSLPYASRPLDNAFRNYILMFQDKIKPSLWSIAFYPKMFLEGITDFYNYFYGNLEIFSLLSKYCERPFWGAVRCASFTTSSGIAASTPTEAEMRFLAFSALAYGAQGLIFNDYRVNSTHVTNAPANANGTKNETVWNAVKTVISEVEAFNHIFFGSYLIGVRYTGNTQYYATSMLKGSFGPLISASSGYYGVLISHLNTKGQDYLVIVSGIFHETGPSSQNVALNFESNYDVHQITLKNGIVTETALTSYSNTYILKRGAYLIFKWT